MSSYLGHGLRRQSVLEFKHELWPLQQVYKLKEMLKECYVELHWELVIWE